jgi:signal transduction histidine kinase
MKLFHSLTTFESARIKLTCYYLLGLLFTILVFTYLTFQAKESAFIRVRSTVDQVVAEENAILQFQKSFDETNRVFRRRVLVADVFLIVGAALLSWWLSGRTLKPIKHMIDQQKEFAQDVSHELRTPLTNISLEIQTNRELYKLPQHQKELLISIEEEVSRMTHMVQGLLLLVRSKAVNQGYSFSTVKIVALLHRSVKAMTPLAKQKQISLNLVSNSEVEVIGDNEQLYQVVLILIDNAIKYSPAKTSISISGSRDQSGAIIKVQDEGFGIPDEDQKEVFNRFYRSKSLGDTKTKGSGLGLAIAHRIVSLHQGTIQLHSTPSVGTTFTVRLPLAS